MGESAQDLEIASSNSLWRAASILLMGVLLNIPVDGFLEMPRKRELGGSNPANSEWEMHRSAGGQVLCESGPAFRFQQA